MLPGKEARDGGARGMSPGIQAKVFGSGPGLSVTLQASWYPHLRVSQVRTAPRSCPAPSPAGGSRERPGPRAHLRLGGELDHRLSEIQLGVGRPHIVGARSGPDSRPGHGSGSSSSSSAPAALAGAERRAPPTGRRRSRPFLAPPCVAPPPNTCRSELGPLLTLRVSPSDPKQT